MTAERGPALRADVALVERGLFPSRAKAREAIEAGLVKADGRKVAKPAEPIAADAQIEAEAAYPWVSRGGVKLAAALEHFSIEVRDHHCLDVGASTGGFTHVLLTNGAASIVCVDVGTAQMHASLHDNPRVKILENTDARALTPAQTGAPTRLVADVSFISLTKILPAVLPLCARNAVAVVLVKPQFEVAPALRKKGVVRDRTAREGAVQTVLQAFSQAGWSILGHMESPIAGGDGNVEYLVAAANGPLD